MNQESAPLAKADPSKRIVAFIIDWVLSVPFQFIGVIPFIGQFLSLMFLIPYWLLRDVGGASIGKRLMGLRVVNYQGETAAFGTRVRRNLILAFPFLVIILPVLGAVAAALAFFAVALIELTLLFVRGERLSDRDTKCLVVSR